MATEDGKQNEDCYGGQMSEIVERFSGFAADYDAYHPRPPAIVADILSGLAGSTTLNLVADLGCGTGLSSRLWADRAESVIGIDPNPDMLAQARISTASPNITYRQGFSHNTGLPDQCADVISCGTSLHWMEPEGTAREVARLLRPGGVVGSYWYRWPPTTCRGGQGSAPRVEGPPGNCRLWTAEENVLNGTGVGQEQGRDLRDDGGYHRAGTEDAVRNGG